MNVRSTAAAAVLVMTGVVTGCSATPSDHHAAKHTPTPSPSPAASSPSPMLTPTASARSPLGAGERMWAAFSDRALPYDAWWARLEPLLSDSARAVYVYDDPRNIPSMKLTGPVRLAAKPPGEAHYTAEVVVPTSKGVFRLDLERHKLTSQWLLYAIKFPPGVH